MTMQTEDYSDQSCTKKRKNFCSVQKVKRRLPITQWLPNYKPEYFIQDVIAGITVALTAIPQGIAYAVIAGLPPEYGLYASLTGGTIYVLFGSCHNVTVGPTAIISAMTAKYVAGYSTDFAVLAAFLSGIVILLTGMVNLGVLVEFISMPVINGFTTAAALQIAASQLKSFFGLQGISGNYFSESMYNFVTNIKTAKLWEPILTTITIIMLVLLKRLGKDCKRTDGFFKKIKWFTSLSRNAVVIIFGMILAFILKQIFDVEPFILIGEIGSGLPKFGLPPFSAEIDNVTYSFVDMVQILGVQSVAIPFVAILETVAIAKAFAEGGRIDATQEMIAIGLCNIIGSCGQSMPVTGSFTRTALNHISGVKTPAGGLINVAIIVIALTLLTSSFQFIPKASLAGLIITAMFSMINYDIISSLWRNAKKDFILFSITMKISLLFGLEYGIIAGVLIEALLLLHNMARPVIEVNKLKSPKMEVLVVVLSENVAYCAVEHVRNKVLKATSKDSINMPVVIDGHNLRKLDYTAAFNLISILKDLERTNYTLMYNFNTDLKKLCLSLEPKLESKFVYGSDPLELSDIIPKEI